MMMIMMMMMIMRMMMLMMMMMMSMMMRMTMMMMMMMIMMKMMMMMTMMMVITMMAAVSLAAHREDLQALHRLLWGQGSSWPGARFAVLPDLRWRCCVHGFVCDVCPVLGPLICGCLNRMLTFRCNTSRGLKQMVLQETRLNGDCTGNQATIVVFNHIVGILQTNT